MFTYLIAGFKAERGWDQVFVFFRKEVEWIAWFQSNDNIGLTLELRSYCLWKLLARERNNSFQSPCDIEVGTNSEFHFSPFFNALRALPKMHYGWLVYRLSSLIDVKYQKTTTLSSFFPPWSRFSPCIQPWYRKTRSTLLCLDKKCHLTSVKSRVFFVKRTCKLARQLIFHRQHV